MKVNPSLVKIGKNIKIEVHAMKKICTILIRHITLQKKLLSTIKKVDYFPEITRPSLTPTHSTYRLCVSSVLYKASKISQGKQVYIFIRIIELKFPAQGAISQIIGSDSIVNIVRFLPRSSACSAGKIKSLTGLPGYLIGWDCNAGAEGP